MIYDKKIISNKRTVFCSLCGLFKLAIWKENLFHADCGHIVRIGRVLQFDNEIKIKKFDTDNRVSEFDKAVLNTFWKP